MRVPRRIRYFERRRRRSSFKSDKFDFPEMFNIYRNPPTVVWSDEKNKKPTDIGALEYVYILLSYMHEEARIRLYTGPVTGSRTSRIKKIVKNVQYWLNHAVEMTRLYSGQGECQLTLFRETIDKYGNICKRYILVTKDATASYFGGRRTIRLNGAMFIDVNARLENIPVFTRVCRFLSRWFPSLKKKCSYTTKPRFVVQMKFWPNQRACFVTDLCHFDIDTDQTVTPIHLRKDTEDEHRGEKQRVYDAAGEFRMS